MRRYQHGTHKGGTINNAINAEGKTALFIAASESNLAKVSELISLGADVNKANKNGETPLFITAYNGNKEIAEILIAAGADINKENKSGKTPLYIACQWGSYPGNKEVAKVLIAAGADLNKSIPLVIACYYGHKDIVNMLINAGCDINTSSSGGITALYNASRNKYKEIVEILIAAGADVNVNKTSALLAACRNHDVDMVKLLLKVPGIDVTPALDAIHYGDSFPTRITNLLLEKKNEVVITETRTLPSNAINTIMYEPIQEGNEMVNFKTNDTKYESNFGRYYKRSTYIDFPQPKTNPSSKRLIENPIYYKAHFTGR